MKSTKVSSSQDLLFRLCVIRIWRFFGVIKLSHHHLWSAGFHPVQQLYCSQVGFGQVLFDRWITVNGHLAVVRMIKSRFDKANVVELYSGTNNASFCLGQLLG